MLFLEKNCFCLIMSSGGGGIRRLEEKLKSCIASDSFYETHQLYTTLYHRYNARQKLAEARKLVTSGAKLLFEKKQPESAAHLSLLYVESLEKNQPKVTEDDIEIIKELHNLMPPTLAELETFTLRVSRWSANCAASPKTGDRRIRQCFAVSYWKKKMYGEARQEFLYSNDGIQFGNMLQEFACLHGFPNEIDLFIAQAVLQLLCIRCENAAHDCFISYTKFHPGLSHGPPFEQPLINFVSFLLLAVKEGKLVVFEILCDKYQFVLQRDVMYFDYLEKIGYAYFGVEKPFTQDKPDLFENLMHSLFEDNGNDDVSEIQNQSMTVEDLD